MTDLPDELQDPGKLLADIWNRLELATSDRTSPLRVATFCTVDINGFPAARSVILRHVRPPLSQLQFHTDIRSPKVAELARVQRSAMHFWDPSSRTQVRLTGTASVSRDSAAVRELLRNQHEGALNVYKSELPPSTPIESPIAVGLSLRPQIENVAVVTFAAISLDWLWLGDVRHQRCRFTFEGGTFSHQWLVP